MNPKESCCFFLFWLLSVGIISCTDMSQEKAYSIAPVATTVVETAAISEPTATPVKAATSSAEPTSIPFPTSQPTPCMPFCAKVLWSTTPLPSPDSYRLKQWTAEDALDVIAVLDTRWANFAEENDYWIYGMMVVNKKRLYTALVAQEAVWRFPDNAYLNQLKWQVAHDLAVAGQSEASNLIAELLENELNKQDDLQEPDISHLSRNGFSGELIPAHNLFGDNYLSWVLKVSKRYDDIPIMQLDGATFAIRKSDEGHFTVMPVSNFWMPWHGNTYEVAVSDRTADLIPEIITAMEIKAGSGSSFTSATLCIYQWQETEWMPVLKNALQEPCFHYPTILLPWEYISTDDGSPDTLDIVAFVNFSCQWHKHHYFVWDGKNYQLDRTYINVPTQFTHYGNIEMLCLNDVWKWAVAEQEFTAIINLMENLLLEWTGIEESMSNSWYGDHIGFGPAYKDFVRFQLGRFYALSGNKNQAEAVFTAIISNPYDGNEHKWILAAQTYLNDLGDLAQAEQALAELSLFDEPVRYSEHQSLGASDVGWEAAAALFSDDDPIAVITLLQSALDNPNFICNGTPCAHIYYLLGLAYEVAGDEKNAVENYWQLWLEFPESSHAIIVQSKLEPIP